MSSHDSHGHLVKPLSFPVLFFVFTTLPSIPVLTLDLCSAKANFQITDYPESPTPSSIFPFAFTFDTKTYVSTHEIMTVELILHVCNDELGSYQSIILRVLDP